MKNLSFFLKLSLKVLPLCSIVLVAETRINILAFGDGGTGTDKQISVANSMKRFCDKNRCDFGILLGDNIYEWGVKNVDDYQFISKFEKPYGRLELPFYVTLGNHDDRGNSQAQVDYTKRSKWWRMPNEYYSKRIENVELISINSNEYDSKQQKFVEETLKKSNATWKVVFGHHPIRSYGSHGHTRTLVKKLLPLICKYNALYVAGHDHDLQVLKADCGAPLIVSGASAKLRSTSKGRRTLFAKSTYGYSWLSFGKDTLTVKMVDENEKVLFEKDYKNLKDTEKDRYYVPVKEDKTTTCVNGDGINGVRYQNRGDDKVLGIYCKPQSEQSIFVEKTPTYVKVANLPGTEYDRFCPGANDYVTGFDVKTGDDGYIEGMYCLPGNDKEEKKEKKYHDIDLCLQESGEISCEEKDELINGIKFDDFSDQHIEGLFCR